MSEKLKPCPFCDGDDIEIIPADIIAGTQYWRIFCYGCGCTQTPISSKNEAIEEWNKRSNPWNTGTPTEEGWYLIKYECLVEGRYKGKLTYRAVHIYYDKYGIYNEDGSIGNDEVWKPIEYQIIEHNRAV